jgi:SpoIIAA-like
VIEYREDASSNLVEIVVDGRVSKAEFDAIAARLEAAIARHGKLRVLEEVKSLGGIEPAAFFADLRFGLRHLNDFSRCAVVSDKRWIELFAEGVGKLVACEIRHFAPDQITAARAWLQEAAPSA